MRSLQGMTFFDWIFKGDSYLLAKREGSFNLFKNGRKIKNLKPREAARLIVDAVFDPQVRFSEETERRAHLVHSCVMDVFLHQEEAAHLRQYDGVDTVDCGRQSGPQTTIDAEDEKAIFRSSSRPRYVGL